MTATAIDAERTGLRVCTHDGTDPAADVVIITPLRIRLTGDANGRLLGAQLLGYRDAEVAKRCDIIAAAIHQRLSVIDLLDLDLTYTPPLSPPRDPVPTPQAVAAPALRAPDPTPARAGVSGRR